MKFFSHNLQNIRCLFSLFQEKNKMKKFLRNLLLFPTLFTSTFGVYAPKMVAVPIIVEAEIIYNIGDLRLVSKVDNYDYFDYGGHKSVHYSGCAEGYDPGLDLQYRGPPMWITPNITKIVSIIPGYELGTDARPLNSFTHVNLELSLHSQSGSSITVSNLENWLNCIIDPFNRGWNFSPKPITLWRRFPVEPDRLQFLADIREVIAKNGGIVPLPDLNGEYASQVPYDFLQLRFDIYPGNLNFSLDAEGKIIDGIVDMKDLAILGENWGKKGAPLEFLADITGPQGLPDGKVDNYDLELLRRHWLKDIREIMPSP